MGIHESLLSALNTVRMVLDDARKSGMSDDEIRECLGIRPHEVTGPSISTPVVLLSGSIPAGNVVDSALCHYGWVITRELFSAWHLCRGGTPVVMVTFLAPDSDGYGTAFISRTQAMYGVCETPDLVPVSDPRKACYSLRDGGKFDKMSIPLLIAEAFSRSGKV